MSYPRYAGLGVRARAVRRGFAGLGGPVTPSAGARAAADEWVRQHPAYGTRTVLPWSLEADGSTVTAPTDNGQSVRFGFGRGVLEAFPPSIGIAIEVAPVAVQPPANVQPPVQVQPPPLVLQPPASKPGWDVTGPPIAQETAAQVPAVVALVAKQNGAAVVPSAIPGEPQPAGSPVPLQVPVGVLPAAPIPYALLAALLVGGWLLLRGRR